MKPIVSIIVPIYNVEEYLYKCINSVLNQTFKNFELILVNDGSTDNSGKICDEYKKKDDRIKVIHQENGGVSSARNTGIKNAKGMFIGFVDPDDWIYPDMFEKLYNNIIENNADISICKHCREINGISNSKTYNSHEIIKTMDNKEAMHELFKGNLYRFALWNKLYKKECFENVSFPNGRIHEDLSTSYKIFSNANYIVFTDYVGYVYVKRVDSILTTRFNEKRLQAFIGWNEILNYMKKNYIDIYDTVVACFTYWSIDNMYYILDQVSEAEDKKKYLNILKRILLNRYKEIIKCNEINYKYKIIVTLLCTNINIILLLNKLRKLS